MSEAKQTKRHGFRSIVEPWNEIELADGTRIRAKMVVTEVHEVVGVRDAHGRRVFGIESAIVCCPPEDPAPKDASGLSGKASAIGLVGLVGNSVSQ